MQVKKLLIPIPNKNIKKNNVSIEDRQFEELLKKLYKK